MASFRQISDVKNLDMIGFSDSAITSDAFSHLSNLRSLKLVTMRTTITDDACQDLRKLRFLEMSATRETTITDNAFRHLTNLQHPDMSWCNQTTITDDAFRHLTNLQF